MSEALEDIKKRCEAASIEYEDQGSLLIWFPRGRETYDLYIEAGPHAEWVANEPFEEYIRLKGYEASWSEHYQTVECNVVLSDTSYSPLLYTKHRLLSAVLRRLAQGQDISTSDSQRVSFKPVKDLTLSIGWCSNVHAFVQEATGYSVDPENLVLDIERSLTLQITGTDVTDHDSAVALLERVGNSLLFQIDLEYDLGLTLEREQPRVPRLFPGRQEKREANNLLPPIKFQYDREAMSLYWYAKSAATMPLLQFLAFYQIIEFYFPKYSQSKALSTIRNILKDPRFDAVRETDVMKVFEAIRVNSKGRFKPEIQQLEAAIEHCVQPDELRTFLLADKDRYEFYDSEVQTKIANAKIPLRGPLFDHRNDVAKRIYEIRCRIVHTKAGFDEQEPLLPFDPEVKYLQYDIDLIKFLARKVLIDASSGQLL